MADERHVEQLKRGTDAWNDWRRGNENVRPDLSGTAFIGARGTHDFSGADFSGSNLSDADFRGARFRNANFRRANLQGANLNGADLENANLDGALLTGALLRNARLDRARISAAMPGVDLRLASLEGAGMSEAILDRARLGRARLHGANLTKARLIRADFNRADLSHANLAGADLEHAGLCEATLTGANLDGANLYDADLSGARLDGARLRKALINEANLMEASFRDADLSDATLAGSTAAATDFHGANLSGADLRGVLLINSDVSGATLSHCWIYGIAAWDLRGEPARQSDLIVTPDGGPTVTVDDLNVAQFVYLLLRHENVRRVFNSVTRRGVLLLGRFGDGGLDVLRRVADTLRDMEYLPMIFDFDRPDDRNYTETVKTLVGLSRFVIVDLSGPSVPQELYATVPHFKIPFVPILQAGRQPHAMLPDLLEYDWMLRPVVRFDDVDALVGMIPDRVVAPAEKRHADRAALLAELFGDGPGAGDD